LVQTASEKAGIPYVNALLQPQHPTCSGAASLTPVFPTRDSLVNRWAGALVDRVTWSIFAEATNRYRAQLRLAPHTSASFWRANHSARAVMGFSRHVVPSPPDWPREAAPTGYWFLDEALGSPSETLAAFVEAGEAPVYIGFGSMSNRDPRRTLDLIIEAVRRARQRAVIAAGWGDLPTGSLSAEVLVVKSAPHNWLFPRVCAVVHHGGAGTTAAGLRAGRPTMVIPHMSDQPYWGRRVHELGVGVKPVPRHKLTVESLSAGLDQLARDARIHACAAALGRAIRTEPGVEAAVAAIERLKH
jgi:UDP:flavonoid glycosyltransferase YjiC (YdhE family)